METIGPPPTAQEVDMNNMNNNLKILSITIILVLLLVLPACSLFTAVTPDTGQLETSVFQTLTAMPTLPPQINNPVPTTLLPPTAAAPSSTPVIPPTGTQPVPTSTATALILATVTPYVLLPTSTNAGPLPTAIPLYSPQVADQFIHYYYNLINQRNYQVTWSLLTDSFKFANNSAAQGGYLGYADFWDTVKRVDIFGVTVTSQGGGYAVVNVSMQYTYKNGSIIPSLQAFNLVYDYSRNTWMFNSFTPIPTSAPTPTILQTPEQFIYNYFANINAGNYTLTWSLLTDLFKKNANNNSYTNYTDFWTTVSRVDVFSVSIASQSGLNAVVNVNMTFNYVGGNVVPSVQKFTLVYDSSRGTWLVDSPH